MSKGSLQWHAGAERSCSYGTVVVAATAAIGSRETQKAPGLPCQLTNPDLGGPARNHARNVPGWDFPFGKAPGEVIEDFPFPCSLPPSQLPKFHPWLCSSTPKGFLIILILLNLREKLSLFQTPPVGSGIFHQGMGGFKFKVPIINSHWCLPVTEDSKWRK